GLDDSYTVTSQDIEAYENSMTPLNTLSKLAGYFLIVILCIGAVILIVLNIFGVRERKYEIGVLTAMGMKKGKVALQFITEIFVITVIAVVIGAGVGAVSSVPVTNALLENQVASQNEQADRIEQGFGRGEETVQTPDSAENESVSPLDSLMGKNNANAYVTEISSAMNFTVVLQMLGIGVLLTIISGAVSMLFIMRYEPLKILANRD
ncbi:MAG: ABC transporter permease, partial [Acutalibacteraceae bacterium]|nr:ABC transporter permease [Acutalibacteraceae bacterium]